MATATDSHEEVIYARAARLGISHELVYEYFDKTIDRITKNNPGKSPDWKLAQAEELVWDHFFPDTRFPGKPPIIQMELTIGIDGVKVEQESDAPHLLSSTEQLTQPLQQIRHKTFTGSGVFEVHSQPLIKNEQMESTGHASQSNVITSKALKMRLDTHNINEVFEEKSQIAQNRFPGESAAWQKWFAESLVWGFYFKDEAFPAKEPPRLFPLRSTLASEPGPVKSPATSGEKWVKFADGSRPGTGADTLAIGDSYRPGGSGTDRAFPVPIDSYRPSSAPLNRSLKGNDSYPPNQHTSRRSSNAALDRSLRVNDSSSGQQASRPPSNPLYEPLERTMENKAIALGIRREFFQYLQRKRDDVRAAHRDCSSQYRHWAADTMVWAKFFKKDPFPSAEPQDGNGIELHSKHCPMAKKCGQTAQVQSTNQPRITYGGSTRPPTVPALKSFKSSERFSDLAPRGKPPMAKSNSLAEGASEPHIKAPNHDPEAQSFRSSERFSEPKVQPPMFLKLEINRLRLTLHPMVSSWTKALMINKNITWTTTTSIKRIVDLFSTIEPSTLDFVENELKCHIRCCELPSGDAIIWNESFLADEETYEDGNKFLLHCFNSLKPGHTGPGVSTHSFPLVDYLKEFKDSEQVSSNRSKTLNDCDGNTTTPNLNRSDLMNQSKSPNAQAAEADWEQYAGKFQATDLDKMMIEEAAKAEGAMRMVYDEVSGQVISLREFASRTLSRAKENCPGDLSDSNPVAKRKAEAEADGDGPAEKKPKL